MLSSSLLFVILHIWAAQGVRHKLRLRQLQDYDLCGQFPKDLLGRFRNPHRIGGGTYGDVYTASDAASDSETVIVKVLKEGQDSDECDILMEIFQNASGADEEGAMHVARCLEQGTTNSSTSWMIQERGGTEDLNSVLLDHNVPVNWSVHRAKKLFRQLLSAIAFINRHGYKHANLTDHFGNVMVRDITSDDPGVKLIDFGRATRVDREPLKHIHMWWWPLLGVPANRGLGVPGRMPAFLRDLVLDKSSAMKVSQDSPVQSVTLARMKDLCANVLAQSPEGSFPEIRQDLREGHLPYFGGPFGQPEASERWNKVCSDLGEEKCDEKPKAGLLAMFVVAHISLLQDALLQASEWFDWCTVVRCADQSSPEEILQMKQTFEQTVGKVEAWKTPTGRMVIKKGRVVIKASMANGEDYAISKVCSQSCAAVAASKTLSPLVINETLPEALAGPGVPVPCCMEVEEDGESFGFLGDTYARHPMKRNTQIM